jgi:hypothetical protein
VGRLDDDQLIGRHVSSHRFDGRQKLASRHTDHPHSQCRDKGTDQGNAVSGRTFVKLDAAAERRRQRMIPLHTLPHLLDAALEPLLGARRFLFMGRMLLLAPLYKRRFARPGDDAPLREVKKRFLLVGVLYHELARVVGAAHASTVARSFLYELACAVQRKAYFPPEGQQASWERFHREHDAQMEEGFIATNVSEVAVRRDDVVMLHITRCRFHECFSDFGSASLTEAFCRSDETVFNEYSATMRFHRGRQVPDTIARGAGRCTFIYERVRPSNMSTA